MFYLIVLLIGFILGRIARTIFKSEKNEDSDIVAEEYVSNTGRKSYKIYKIEKGFDELGESKDYKIYLGEVSEED